VGIAATPTGRGYWLIASDGGVFTYGDAGFFGSAANLRLKAPIVGIAATASGKGYWLLGRDGGIFTFGDAPFLGAAQTYSSRAVAIGSFTVCNGYLVLHADGAYEGVAEDPSAGPSGARCIALGNTGDGGHYVTGVLQESYSPPL
jgi:hypothetical protein